jgi:hypothetical protein
MNVDSPSKTACQVVLTDNFHTQHHKLMLKGLIIITQPNTCHQLIMVSGN